MTGRKRKAPSAHKLKISNKQTSKKHKSKAAQAILAKRRKTEENNELAGGSGGYRIPTRKGKRPNQHESQHEQKQKPKQDVSQSEALCENPVEDDEQSFEAEETFLQSFAGATMSAHHEPVDGDYDNDDDDDDSAGDGERLDLLMDEYERTPRTASWERQEQRESTRLPVKSATGRVQLNQRIQPKQLSELDTAPQLTEPEAGDEEDLTQTETEKEEGMEASERLSPAELTARKQARFARLRLQLASMANDIVDDPDENVALLTELDGLCRDSDERVQEMAMLSLVEVYRDICPGYRIRLPSQKEVSAKQVSRDVKKVWKFEGALLRSYRAFVEHLRQLCSRVIDSRNATRMGSSHYRFGVVGARCLCALLRLLPHFNCANQLILSVVPLLNHPFDDAIAAFANTAVSDVLWRLDCADQALEIVRLISRAVHARRFQIRPEMLRCLARLPLKRSVLDAASGPSNTGVQSKGKRPSGKKQRKLKSAQPKPKRPDETAAAVSAELSRDLELSRAEVGHRKRMQTQLELLKHVFGIYFSVLKNAVRSDVLPVVLEGLAKFGQLVNVELVLDMLACLRQLMSSESLSTLSLLHCVVAAFRTLSGQGEAVVVDVREFYQSVYALIPSLATATTTVASDERDEIAHDSVDKPIALLLECVEQMFLRRRQVSLERVAAFCKRLSLLSLCVSAAQSAALLHAVNALFCRYPQARQLLDDEPSSANSAFRAELDDPDHANGRSSSIWELSLLARSHHPFLRKHSRSIASNETLSLDIVRQSPQELLASLSAGFRPSVQAPRHHLDKRRKAESKKAAKFFVSSMSCELITAPEAVDEQNDAIGSAFADEFGRYRRRLQLRRCARLRCIRQQLLARN